jgi:hypothetical protein
VVVSAAVLVLMVNDELAQFTASSLKQPSRHSMMYVPPTIGDARASCR